MSRTALADHFNEYEIIAAADEAGIDHEGDPMWSTLSPKEKWDVIKDMNGQTATKKHAPNLPTRSQEQMIAKVIAARK